MLKKGFISTALITAILVIAVGGATLAWFTATAPVITNEFTAGTVKIATGETVGAGQVIAANWNPGDYSDFDLDIINTGTKSVYIRARVDMMWLSSRYRIFVVFTGDKVQLLAIEWGEGMPDTPLSGPVATGSLLVGYPSDQSYIKAMFSNLDNTEYLLENRPYKAWCIDHWEGIEKNTTYHNVRFYDPFTNPNWFDEIEPELVNKDYWRSIPFDKLAYILDQDFISKGYTVDDIQDAIWHYTNEKGSAYNTVITAGAWEIVHITDEATYEGNSLSTDNVSFSLGEKWVKGTDGYYYYMDPVPGSYKEGNVALRTILFDAKTHLKGRETTNKYQGKTLTVMVQFEAIQSSNNAVHDQWPGNPYPVPA